MKITETLNSAEQVDALEAAIRALPGGNAAVDTAVADALAAREADADQAVTA